MTTNTETRPDPFGFGPTHIVDMRVEMASENDLLPADWPCEIVRRAAKLMKERAQDAIHTEGRNRLFVSRTKASKTPVVVDDVEQPTILIESFAARYEAVNEHIAGLDPVVAISIADAWEHQADDMADLLAHVHAVPVGRWVVQDEGERTRDDWTRTLRAALAYLREDAPKAGA